MLKGIATHQKIDHFLYLIYHPSPSLNQVPQGFHLIYQFYSDNQNILNQMEKVLWFSLDFFFEQPLYIKPFAHFLNVVFILAIWKKLTI